MRLSDLVNFIFEGCHDESGEDFPSDPNPPWSRFTGGSGRLW